MEARAALDFTPQKLSMLPSEDFSSEDIEISLGFEHLSKINDLLCESAKVRWGVIEAFAFAGDFLDPKLINLGTCAKGHPAGTECVFAKFDNKCRTHLNCKRCLLVKLNCNPGQTRSSPLKPAGNKHDQLNAYVVVFLWRRLGSEFPVSVALCRAVAKRLSPKCHAGVR
jgi:hypothetical protein